MRTATLSHFVSDYLKRKKRGLKGLLRRFQNKRKQYNAERKKAKKGKQIRFTPKPEVPVPAKKQKRYRIKSPGAKPQPGQNIERIKRSSTPLPEALPAAIQIQEEGKPKSEYKESGKAKSDGNIK